MVGAPRLVLLRTVREVLTCERVAASMTNAPNQAALQKNHFAVLRIPRLL